MQLPIIALTAHEVLADEKQKPFKVSVNDYVTKPIQMEQIIPDLNALTKTISRLNLQIRNKKAFD